LYQNAVGLILHGLNLHRDQVYETDSVERTIRGSRTRIDIDMEDGYQRKVKTLYSAIVDFTSRSGVQRLSPEMADRIYELRDVAADIVQAVKSVKHLRKNVLRYTTKPQGAVTRLYDGLRGEIARILVEVHKLELAAPEERTVLWLDQERVMVEEDERLANRRVDELIRTGELKADQATSFLNDSGYAYAAMRDLIEAARKYYGERGTGTAEVERILELDAEEVGYDDLPSALVGGDQQEPLDRDVTVKKQS
jgi:phosphate:Na+ symporter